MYGGFTANRLRYRARHGIGIGIIAVIVIVVIVIAGTAAYWALGSGSKSSSTTSLSSTSSVAQSYATSSSSSTGLSASLALSTSSTSSGAASISGSATSSSSGSTAVNSTVSCSSTSAASTSTSGTVNFVPLLKAYSAMTISYSGVSNSTTFNSTQSYNTIYSSATTYKVNVTYSAAGQTNTATAYILKSNNSAEAVDEAGFNLTGSQANSVLVGLFAGFSLEAMVADQLPSFTSTAYFHVTNSSTVTIGPYTFPVTNYSAKNLPETVPTCGAGTFNLTAYSISVGNPTISTTKLVIMMHLAGSTTNNGQTTNVNYDIKLTSLQVAA